MVYRIKSRSRQVTIAVVGKYTRLHDAYFSVMEALYHAGYAHRAEVEILWVNSEALTHENIGEALKGVSGILIPGGFGDRGVEGMILAAEYARIHGMPFFGICLGMQVAVIELARNVCGMEGANSTEFDCGSAYPVIDIMEDQQGIVIKGGTMRLGAYPCALRSGTLLARIYGEDRISERHRHRFEFNNAYREQFAQAGLAICGESPDGTLIEAVELPAHPFFVGVQFHPEFKSRPNRPQPIFRDFVGAALEKASEHDQ
jgi:CTP synthase